MSKAFTHENERMQRQDAPVRAEADAGVDPASSAEAIAARGAWQDYVAALIAADPAPVDASEPSAASPRRRRRAATGDKR